MINQKIMKKIVLTIFCLLLHWIFIPNIQAFQSGSHLNNKSTYTQFDLLETYLTKHKQKIVLFQEKYYINWNKDLDILLTEIENLILISKKIKNKKIEWYNHKEISSHIVKRIKIINSKLEYILTQEKKLYQINLKKKKEIYSNIWVKAGNQLIKIIEKLVNRVTQSDISIEKKMKIIIHLKNLQKNSQKLRDFKNNDFSNEINMQESFIFILREIRDDMSTIKKILKK